jgi:hypothetical protein
MFENIKVVKRDGKKVDFDGSKQKHKGKDHVDCQDNEYGQEGEVTALVFQ